MPVPDFETLMLPILRAFGKGAKNVSECLPHLRKEFGISDDEAAMLLPSGKITVLASRAHWARSDLAKAGLLTSVARNHHVLTEAGKAVLANPPPAIGRAWLSQSYPAFAAWVAASKGSKDKGGQAPGIPQGAIAAPSPSLTPDEQIDAAYAEIEASLRDDLLDVVRKMDAIRFERLVLDLLTAMGYGTGTFGQSNMTPASGDGGIDGIIYEDALGLDAVYVQAKRHQAENKVGSPAIQQFIGALTGEGATKGVFVTTSSFSAEAKNYLKKVPQHRVVLIDGTELALRMIRHGVGVRVKQTYVIRDIDNDYFADTP